MWRTEHIMIISVYWASCKVPVVLSDFKETWIFLTDLKKKYPNIKFHENLSSGSSFHVDGETVTTKLTVMFYNFANTPNIWQWLNSWLLRWNSTHKQLSRCTVMQQPTWVLSDTGKMRWEKQICTINPRVIIHLPQWCLTTSAGFMTKYAVTPA